jgi:IS1 family transposase/transposase-like protein
MIQTTHTCKKCNSANIVLNGKNKCGSQTYKCKDCGCCRVLFSIKKTENIDLDALSRTYEERNSYRSSGRIFGISHVTVFNYLKKKARSLADFKTTIIPTQNHQATLEVDEIFSYILLKVNQIRIWIVLNKENRQIVSFFIGDGSMESCKRLWRKLPYEFLKCNSFSDFWKSYNCIPKETHTKVGKETGLTNHVERLNNTIRQRFSRFVRKTLSFSKKEYMLNLHFKLWAFNYNINCIS